ncbi:MAG: PEP-CTERM sorting domain-containing protein [Fuerstiella sp.]
MKKVSIMRVVVMMLACASIGFTDAPEADAGILFQDDFESGSLGLPNWEHNKHGIVVDDPFEADKAIKFTQGQSGGDLYSRKFDISAGTTYTFSFDYLGKDSAGYGFAGLYWGAPGTYGAPENWLAWPSGPVNLINDNSWHHYSIDFTSADTSGVTTGIGVKFEDFYNGQHAHFDNVLVTTQGFVSSAAAVPEPSSFALLGLGVTGLFSYRRRQRRQAT